MRSLGYCYQQKQETTHYLRNNNNTKVHFHMVPKNLISWKQLEELEQGDHSKRINITKVCLRQLRKPPKQVPFHHDSRVNSKNSILKLKEIIRKKNAMRMMRGIITNNTLGKITNMRTATAMGWD